MRTSGASSMRGPETLSVYTGGERLEGAPEGDGTLSLSIRKNVSSRNVTGHALGDPGTIAASRLSRELNERHEGAN